MSIIALTWHNFFEVHGLGETTTHLHADNCTGQNKNNYMLQYLMWRTLVGLHTDITLSFDPDWTFGLFKQLHRRTKVSCSDDIAAVANASATVNVAQLVGTQEGETLVHAYKWDEFFSPYLAKLPGMKQCQHFRFSSRSPGTIYMKVFSNSEEKSFNLLIDPCWEPTPDEMPLVIDRPGLSHKRQTYLLSTIAAIMSVIATHLMNKIKLIQPFREQEQC